jgi:phytoene dehydrogenase-like protein
LAGLSCAALLAHCGKHVAVLESHDAPGGCAHTWERRGYHFESGPSLYSGLSMDPSPNPLKNIFQIVEEDCEWITYDRWGTVLPNGKKFAAKIGPEEFGDVLREHGGPNAEQEFAKLMTRMKPLSDAAQAFSSMALREDPAVALTVLRYPKEIAMTLSQGSQLTNPFSKIMEELDIQDSFVKNWLDMLCFLLQGLPASGTLNTVMAYMLADWYRPGVTLDFPRGGSGAIVDALVRAVRKHPPCTVSLNSHVEEIIIENGKAVGVQLLGGKIVRAKQAIVSNADPYMTHQLLRKARANGSLPPSAMQFMDRLINTDPNNGGMTDLRSFIHLHAGIDGTGLPTVPSADFPAQWAVIRNWDGPLGVEDPRNIVLCSVPSMLDPAMAPDGNHVIHAYTPATEPCTYFEVDEIAWISSGFWKDEWWEGLDRTSDEYRKKKEEAADFLWKAISEYIPNAKERAVPGTVQIGTPLTHERFLRRSRGAYGPRVDVSQGQTLPGHTTPIPGLYMCGDYTFPSIGVPATAASGAITANTLVSIWDHWKMLDKIRLPVK